MRTKWDPVTRPRSGRNCETNLRPALDIQGMIASAASPQTAPVYHASPTYEQPQTGGRDSWNIEIGDWFAKTFGIAAIPAGMVAGAAVGGGMGMLTLGPFGALAGGAAGAMLGMLVVGLRP